MSNDPFEELKSLSGLDWRLEGLVRKLDDPLLFKQVEKTLIEDGKARSVVAGKYVRWWISAEFRNYLFEFVRSENGHAPHDLYDLVERCQKRWETPRQKERRMGFPIAGAMAGGQRRVETSAERSMRRRPADARKIGQDFGVRVNGLWRSAVDSGRVLRMTADRGYDRLLAPGENVERSFDAQIRYLITDEVPITPEPPAEPLALASSSTGTRSMDHVDKEYFERMRKIQIEKRHLSISKLAEDAIEFIGLPQNSQFETFKGRLRRKYKPWLAKDVESN